MRRPPVASYEDDHRRDRFVTVDRVTDANPDVVNQDSAVKNPTPSPVKRGLSLTAPFIEAS